MKSCSGWMTLSWQMWWYLETKVSDLCNIKLVKLLCKSVIALFLCQLEVVKVCATRYHFFIVQLILFYLFVMVFKLVDELGKSIICLDVFNSNPQKLQMHAILTFQMLLYQTIISLNSLQLEQNCWVYLMYHFVKVLFGVSISWVLWFFSLLCSFLQFCNLVLQL